MAETPAADAVVAAARTAYDRLYQQATTPNLASAALQALLTETLGHLQGVLRHPALPAEGTPQAADKYHALFNSLDQGVCLLELLYDAQGAASDYRFLEVNPAFARQTGLREAPGQLGSDLTPGTEAHWLDTYAHVLQTGEPVRFEHYHQGTGRWYEAYAARVGGAGSRQVCTVFNDVTARRLAAQRQQFLLHLSDLLRPLADPLAIQQAALHFVGEHLDLDRLLYNEIDPDVTTYTVRASYAREGFLAYGGVQPMGPFTESVRALQQGVTKVVYDVETDASFSPAEKAICAGIHVRAFVTVPLVKNGRWVLNLVAHSRQPRSWPPHELLLLEETAERTWAAAERARAEEALRHSEEQFRTVANLVPDLLWRTEPDGHTSWYNQRWFDYTGQTLPEAAGEGWADALHPDDRAQSVQRYRGALSTGQPLRQEHRLRSAQGEYHWFVVTALPARDAQGTLTQWFGAATDIEAQKQAEASLRTFAATLEAQVAERTHELQASRDLLQSVFDTSLILLTVCHAVRNEHGTIADFRLVLVNQEATRETGRPDLVGQRLTQALPGLVTGGLFELMCRTVDTNEPQHGEVYYPGAGVEKWYACMFVKLGDGLVGTYLDITARKRAEQEQLRSFTLLQQAEAVAGLGSWSYELATGQLLPSPGLVALLGLAAGKPVTPAIYRELAVDADRSRAEQFVQQVTAGTANAEQTLRLRVGAQVKTLRLQAVVQRDAAGHPLRVLGVDLDISEVQRLEADNLQLRLAQQQRLFEAVLEAQEVERKRIAEGLHNGIGQLLYATKLRLDALHVPILGTHPELVSARREADQLLAEAIRQTRTLSHELVPAVLTDFGLAPALAGIARNLSSAPLRVQCTVALEEVPPLPQLLQVALYRIAQELLQNVVKHARATQASLALEAVPGFVLLRVEDNGVGFTPAATAPAGLGLHTIRSRVALLNGQLELGSSPAYGTYVRLRIPLPPLAPPTLP